MKQALLAALVPAALLVAGCGSFYAEAEQPQVCLAVLPKTFDIVAVTGARPLVGPFQGSFSGQVDLGINDALPDFIVSGSPDTHVLRFLGLDASIAPTSSLANFNYLQGLTLGVTNSATSRRLGVYGGGLPAGSMLLHIDPLDAANNLVTFLANGNMVLTVQGSVNVPAGAPVPTSITASVTGCFSAKVKKTFDEIINGTK
jgi:hypothetical protein